MSKTHGHIRTVGELNQHFREEHGWGKDMAELLHEIGRQGLQDLERSGRKGGDRNHCTHCGKAIYWYPGGMGSTGYVPARWLHDDQKADPHLPEPSDFVGMA